VNTVVHGILISISGGRFPWGLDFPVYKMEWPPCTPISK